MQTVACSVRHQQQMYAQAWRWQTSSGDSHQRRIRLLCSSLFHLRGAALPCPLQGCTPRFRPPRPPLGAWFESPWGSGVFKTQLSLLSRCPSCHLVMITVRRALLSMPKSCKVHDDASMVDSAQADSNKGADTQAGTEIPQRCHC